VVADSTDGEKTKMLGMTNIDALTYFDNFTVKTESSKLRGEK